MARRGWALAARGAVEEGLSQLYQGLAIYREIGHELELPELLAMQAEVYGKSGHAEEGRDVLAEALALVHRNAERYYEAELYRLMGELWLQQTVSQEGTAERVMLAEADRGAAVQASTSHQQAEACFRQAIDIARHQQAKSLELRAVMSLSRLWLQHGKRAEARTLLADIYAWFTEGFDTLDIQEAKALLKELR
jgi:predicted ATPase